MEKRLSSNQEYKKFEEVAKRILEQYFSVTFHCEKVEGIDKAFDFVSLDRSVIGDAKYYSQSRIIKPKISEYIWLLEKTKAKKKFLVFGNNIDVPQKWLKRYKNLLHKEFMFFFIDNIGSLTTLWP